MVRVRPPLTAARAAGLAALFAAALPAGCTAPGRVTESVSRAVKSAAHMGTPAPATQFMCVWQRRLAPLPDPTREGTMAPGMAGQMFLIASDGSPADVAGDVTVALYDDTKRPAGAAPMTPEVFHFTRDTVRRLRTDDERFGKSYVLYLPWPAGWRDVDAVRVLARYEAPGISLHSGEVRLALDLTEGDGQVWTESGGVPVAARPVGLDARTVPDGAKVVQQAQARAAAGTAPGIVPAAGATPQAPDRLSPAQPGPMFVKSGVLPPPATPTATPFTVTTGVLPPPSAPAAPDAATDGPITPVMPPIIVGRP